jgi:hypothetical protein
MEVVVKQNTPWTQSIGRFVCFFLLSFFSFQSDAYPAASSYFDKVQKTYIGYYQRPADPAGLIYWAGRLDASNGSLNDIIDAFANSDESQKLYGAINSSSISSVVDNIYLALFNRYADAGGRTYYVNSFNDGHFPDGRRCTPGTIVLNILDGAVSTDLQSVNNKLSAANLFTRTIDPELDGLNPQVTYAGDGDVIAGRNFLNVVTSDPATAQTQTGTTAYIQANIADASDPIQTMDVAGSWFYVPVNTERTLTTALGVTGLSSSLGSADQYMAVLKIGPLTPGQRYEATLHYTGGTDIGYAHSWLDGNPFGRNWASFLGIGTGTGSGELRAKQAKFLFSSASQSTSSALYWVLRSTSGPLTFSFGVSSPSGVTTNSQDQWGYYYVDDFDASRYSPWQFIR